MATEIPRFYRFVWKQYKKHWKISVPMGAVIMAFSVSLGFVIFSAIMAVIFAFCSAFTYKYYESRANVPHPFPFFKLVSLDKIGLYFLCCMAFTFPLQAGPMIFGF